MKKTGVLALLLAAAMLCGCTNSSREDELQSQIDDLKSQLENKDTESSSDSSVSDSSSTSSSNSSSSSGGNVDVPTVSDNRNPLVLMDGILVMFDGTPLLPFPDGYVLDVKYGGENNDTVVMSTNKSIYAFRDGKFVFSDEISFYNCSAVSQDGNAVAYMNENRALVLYDLDINMKMVVDDTFKSDLDDQAANIPPSVCISPDGKTLLYSEICTYTDKYLKGSVYKFANGKKEVVDEGSAIAVSNNGQFMHYYAFGTDNVKNEEFGYTVINSAGEKLLSGCTLRSLTISADASEAMYSAAESNFNNHSDGLYYLNCRTGKEKKLIDNNPEFYPIKTVRRSMSTFSSAGGGTNSYLNSTSRDSMLGDWFASNGVFFRLDENAELKYIDLPSEQCYFKYIENSDKIYYQEYPLNTDNTLYITDLKTAMSKKIADNVSCFGAFPDGSGVIYVTKDDELYFADDNGSIKKIDVNVGHPLSGTGLEPRFNICLIGNTSLIYYNQDSVTWFAYNVKTGERTSLENYEGTNSNHEYKAENSNEYKRYHNASSISAPFYNLPYFPIYKNISDYTLELSVVDENGKIKVIKTFDFSEYAY